MHRCANALSHSVAWCTGVLNSLSHSVAWCKGALMFYLVVRLGATQVSALGHRCANALSRSVAWWCIGVLNTLSHLSGVMGGLGVWGFQWYVTLRT